MNEKLLKCASCGAVVEELIPCHCACGIQCCGAEMKEIMPLTTDQGTEKHLPVVESLPDGTTRIRIGSMPHPMSSEHWIQWIELSCEHGRIRRMLKPEDPPEAVFPVPVKPGMKVREYCNLHGLWELKL